LSNAAVEDHHAIIKSIDKEGSQIYVVEACSETSKDNICISGKFMSENKDLMQMEIKHLDRIAFGTNSIYLF